MQRAFCAENNPEILNLGGIDNNENSIQHVCASFALKLMAKHKLPATTVDDIIESTANLITFAEEIQAQGQRPVYGIQDSLKELATNKKRLSYKCHGVE